MLSRRTATWIDSGVQYVVGVVAAFYGIYCVMIAFTGGTQR